MVILSAASKTIHYSFLPFIERRDSPFFRAIFQSDKIARALERIRELGAATKQIPSFSSRATTFLIWSPLIVYPLVVFKDSLPHAGLRQAVELIHGQSGNIAHTASFVSAIALIYFGQPLIGGATLAFMALAYLHEKGYIPETVWKGFSGCSIAFSIVQRDWIFIALLFAQFLLPSWMMPEEKTKETKLVKVDISAFLQQTNLLERSSVNYDHIFYSISQEEDRLLHEFLNNLRAVREGKFAPFLSDCKNRFPAWAQPWLTHFEEDCLIALGIHPLRNETHSTASIGYFFVQGFLREGYKKNVVVDQARLINQEAFASWKAQNNLLGRSDDDAIALFLIQHKILVVT